MELPKRIAKNILWNYLGAGWQLILILCTTPFILHQFGNEPYSLYVLIGSTILFLTNIEYNLGDALVKYVADEKDSQRINRLINTGFFLYLFFGAGTLVSTFIFTRYFLTSLFDIPEGLVSTARFAFYAIFLSFSLSLPFTVLGATIRGFQRLDLLNLLRAISQTVIITITLILLYIGLSLKEVAIGISVAGFLTTAANGVVLRKIFPDFALRLRFAHRKELKEIFQFGLASLVGGLSGYSTYQCNIVLIGIFLPILYITLYSIADLFSSKIYNLAGLICGAIYPAASQLWNQGEYEKIKVLYQSSTIFVIAFTLPFSIMIFVYGPRIIDLWIGKGYEESTIFLRFLCVAWFLNTIGSPSTVTSKGIGRPDIEAVNATLVMVLNVTLNILLMPLLGVIGMMIATILSQFIGITRNIYVVCNILGIPKRQLLKRILTIISIFLMMAPFLYLPLDAFFIPIKILLFLFTSTIFVWCISLTAEEKEVIKSLISERGS